MTRTDMHLDAMLRHLGAAYYDAQYGRASRADVARALDTVEDHLAENDQRRPAGTAAPAGARRPHRGGEHHRPGRWTRRVRDVMTTSVVTVDRITPYKEIARLLAEHQISGVPVLTMGRHVAGVVSEADLLAVEDEDARRARMNAERPGRLHWPARQPRRWGLIAGELMTTPAVTIHPDATIPGAARVMNARHVRRLPVVDADGTLIGIISRRDLLSVFLRPDPDIAADTRELLDEILPGNPASVNAVVHEGVVVLTGTLDMTEDRDLIPVAIRLIWHIDGVVDVLNRLSEHRPGTTPHRPAPTPRSAPDDAPGGAAHRGHRTAPGAHPAGST
jgi:CBS domain-containing protein